MKKYTTEEITSHIERILRNTKYPSAPEGLYEPISYSLSAGGKRLRPLLLLLTYNMYSDNMEEATKVAIALETYHNYTLMHDDLMDNADTRRGKPAVHKRWDANTAILSGDTMLVLAYRWLISASTQYGSSLIKTFTDMAVSIGEGQQYDMNFENRMDVSEAEYIEMIRLKTGVLIGCAAKMGAILAEASQEDVCSLYDFGETLGLAFQLQDDYLDVYGNPETFGKKIGGDIVSNKKTYLLIKAIGAASGEDREELLRWINAKTFRREEKIAAITDIYNRLGIDEMTRSAISKYFDKSNEILNRVNVSDASKDALRDFAASLVGRKY